MGWTVDNYRAGAGEMRGQPELKGSGTDTVRAGHHLAVIFGVFKPFSSLIPSKWTYSSVPASPKWSRGSRHCSSQWHKRSKSRKDGFFQNLLHPPRATSRHCLWHSHLAGSLCQEPVPSTPAGIRNWFASTVPPKTPNTYRARGVSWGQREGDRKSLLIC